MEQDPSRKKIEGTYQVLWHQSITEDLASIPQGISDSIIQKTQERLRQYPHLVGQPLKGTTKKLWKIRFSKYRIIYTIRSEHKEVWVIGVKPRDIVYRNNSVHSLLRLTVAIHERSKESGL